MSGRHRRAEDGATAVLVGLLAVLLISMAGLAIDLGNTFVRKRDVQAQADLAALAAGADLPATSATPNPGDPAVQTVARYLYENQPQEDRCGGPCFSEVVLRSRVTDGSLANGEVKYGSYNASGTFVPSLYKVTVITPPTFVKFGIAGVMGFSDTNVSARATVGLGSLGASAEMPFYAVGNGCDYGAQRLSQPATGRLDPVNPPSPLQLPTTDGSNLNTSMTLDPTPVVAVPLNFTGTNATITITGRGLASVNRVAFLRGTADSPNVFEVSSGFTTNNNAVSGIQIPSTYLRTSAVWWVRVYKPATSTGTAQEKKDGWSRVLLSNGTPNMTPVQIGDDVLTCSGANDGNFGSLKLPRVGEPDSTSNGWLPTNMAIGLKSPLTLDVLPGASTANPFCSPGGPNVVYSTTTGTPTVQPRTNCVDTDTGLTANAATAGLITGTTYAPTGRLAGDTSTGVLTGAGRNGNCGPGRTSTRRSTTIGNINNDTLTCYMTSATTPLSAITSATYSGGTALDSAIYSSPRFCYVPVLGAKPVMGGSQRYGIVDVRPCFITGEAVTSTYNNQVFLDGTENGIKIQSNKVTEIRVVFFNKAALPNTGPIGDYTGTGIPSGVQMVD